MAYCVIKGTNNEQYKVMLDAGQLYVVEVTDHGYLYPLISEYDEETRTFKYYTLTVDENQQLSLIDLTSEEPTTDGIIDIADNVRYGFILVSGEFFLIDYGQVYSGVVYLKSRMDRVINLLGKIVPEYAD